MRKSSGFKTIKIKAEVYEKLRSMKRANESFSDLIERLLEDFQKINETKKELKEARDEVKVGKIHRLDRK